MTGNLRAGVIGLGMMGRQHVRVLRGMPDVDLVAVADAAGDPYGVAPGVEVVSDVDDLISAHLDLCVVATPTDVHESIALRLAAAGVNCLVEKPLAADTPACDRVVDAFARAGLVGCVGHIERYNAAVRALKAKLSSHALGYVYQVTTERQGPFPGRVRDVGVVKDLATHDLDLTTWIAGSIYTSVAARIATRADRPHEDLVAVVGTLADGTITNHLVNWMTPVKIRQIVVTGEKGCLTADTLTADLTFNANGSLPAAWDAISRFRGVTEGDMVRYALEKPEPLVVELEQFCAAVRGESASIVTMEDGRRALQVAEAVLESARTDRVVELSP